MLWGKPSTQVIYGGDSINLHDAAGFRLDSGFWLDSTQTYGIDAGFFLLGQQNAEFSAFSDSSGLPVIARPVINAQTGNEGAYVDSLANNITGGVTVDSTSKLGGWEMNGSRNLVKSTAFRLDGLLGFRYLNLVESLNISDQFGSTVPGELTYLGQPINTAYVLADSDIFRTRNNFYGGQLGMRLNWLLGQFTIAAAGRSPWYRSGTHADQRSHI